MADRQRSPVEPGDDATAHPLAGAAGENGRPGLLDPELDPPLEVIEPIGPHSALVASSPHSGDIYPQSFLAASRLSPMALRRSEDAHVDRLFAGVALIGAPMIKARFPRAYLDVNREPYELDPRMFEGRLPSFVNSRSMRVASGLGTIARLVGESQEIYAGRLPVSEALRRIEGLYRPYHQTLRELIARARRLHGTALLVDCHSMPSWTFVDNGRDDGRRPDVILGDRYGTTCEPRYMDCVEDALRRRGYRVQRNKPYAGGYITEYFGALARSCDAMQIEVNRSLYMDERTLEPHAGFDTLAAHLTESLAELEAMVAGDAAAGRGEAAE